MTSAAPQPVAAARRQLPPWWLEFPVLGVLYAVFETARDHVHAAAGPSIRNARWLEDLERWTWTLHEPRLNHFVFAHKTLAQGMNIYYGTVHFVVPPVILIWLWRRHPDRYRRVLYILAAVTISGIVFFAATPLAPPRLVPAEAHATFRDTTPYGGLGPLDRGNFKDANPYAAMPSLHMAWSTWCACVIIGTGRRRRRWLALLYPLATLTVVVGTANHWIGDAVGAWLLLAAAWWAVPRAVARVRARVQRRGGQRSDRGTQGAII